MRKSGKKMTKGEACKLLIIGIIMGTVFIFGTSYWNKAIEPSEAIRVNATYTSYKESIRRNNTKGIFVKFSDCEQLYIDGECVNDDLREQLEELEKDTKVQLLIHPNADTILDMRTSNKIILEFHDAMEKLEGERKGFFFLGLFCYFSALVGLVRILKDSKLVLVTHRKKKEEALRKKKDDRKENILTEEQKLKKMSKK